MLDSFIRLFTDPGPASFINFNFLPKYAPYFVDGVANTLLLSFVAVLLAVLPALMLALMRLSKSRVLRTLSGAYIALFRSTPLLVQMSIIYFGVFNLIKIPNITILGFIRLNSFIPFAFTLALNSAAYVAEIFRGGIMAVDQGQMEAGRSLGFGYVATMRHIILPQAFKAVLPTLANEFIVLLKETAVAGYVSVADLTYAGNVIGGNSYDYLFPLLMTAVIYLAMVMFFTFLVGKLERRLRNSER